MRAITRRRYLGILLAAPPMMAGFVSANAAGPTMQDVAGRELRFQIEEGKFGDADSDNIEAVLRSTAESIWQHCPATRWELPGFLVYRSRESPIVDYAHREDGRVAIGLNVEGRQWAQFAYQFAHEFCHALAGHSNQWKEKWIRGRKANHWLEESLCETASLFALRAMGKSWQTKPPYRNWMDYAKSLTGYAQDRLDKTLADLPADGDFTKWFREHEAIMRKNSTDRDRNNVVAARLLPIFEATPEGWEALTTFNLGPRDGEKTLAAHFRDWKEQSSKPQQEFIAKVAKVFGV